MKKKVLLFIDWFLPGTNSGGPVSSYTNLINHFSSELDFYVITRNTDYCSTTPYQGVEVNKWNELRSNLFVHYLKEEDINKATLKHIGDALQADICLINGIYSWKFSILPLLLYRKSNSPVIVSARGMLNPQAFATGALKKKVFLFLLKLLGVYKNVVLHATNDDEAKYITNALGNVNTKVAPNLPKVFHYNLDLTRDKKEQELKICSFARISPEKGTLNLLKSLVKISSEHIISLDLYGSIYNTEYWEECQKLISKLSSNIQVKHCGSVKGDEVRNCMKNYHIMALLSEGENFGHAILESFSIGCPVVISNKTPWIGLEPKKVGWDLPLTNLEKVTHVIENISNMGQEEYSKWSQSAYLYAKNFCENPSLLEANKKLFNLVP